MFYAMFTACMIQASTGAVECANSYTEMSSVMRKGDSCEVQATILQNDAINMMLIRKPGFIASMQRNQCFDNQVDAVEAAIDQHNLYVKAGIKSVYYGF